LELGFLKSRISLNINAYQSETRDQTIPATISYATGYNSAYINAGQLQTQGLEMDLKLTPLISAGDFNWNMTLSYSYNTSKVISIMELLLNYQLQTFPMLLLASSFPL